MSRPPPRWERVLGLLLEPAEREATLGELEEVFRARRDRLGEGRARAEYRLDVVRLAPFLVWRRLRGGGFDRRRSMTREGRRWAMGMSEWTAAWRTIVRAPLASAVGIVVLGLAAGSAGAFSMVADHVLLGADDHVGDAESLRRIHVASASEPDGMFYFSEPLRRDLAERVPAFAGVAAVFPQQRHLTPERGEPRWVAAEVVSPGYFDILGVPLVLGRGFLPDESVPGRGYVVVLGHRLWLNALGADPNVLGTDVRLDGHLFTVVGVAPAGFRGLERPGSAELWLPPGGGFDPTNSNYTDGGPTNRFTRVWQYAVARLRPGTDPVALPSALERARAGIAADHPDDPFVREFGFQPHPAAGPAPGFRPQVRMFVTILAGAVGLLVLLTLVNLVHLGAARAAWRSHALAVTRVLGASVGRLRLRLGLEAFVLGVAGGLAGVLVLGAVTWRLQGQRITGLGLRLDALRPEATDVAWTLALALSLALLAALPAIAGAERASRPRGRLAAGALITAGSRGAFAMIAAQIALTAVLLVGAGLMTRTVQNLGQVELGIPVDHLSAFTLVPTKAGYATGDVPALFERVEAEVRQQRGVRAVGSTWLPPYGHGRAGLRVMREGGSWPDDAESPRLDRVTAGYLRALDLRVLDGELPSDEWTGGLVLSRALAAAIFDGPAVGRRVQVDADGTSEEVLAVVEDARLTDPRTPPEPRVFQSLRNGFPITSVTVVVRSDGPPGSLTPALRAMLRDVDPSLPVSDLGPLRDRVALLLTEQRLLTEVGAAFALLGLLLAAAGLHGTLAQAVAARTREIGVRTALGASPSGVLRTVLRRSALTVAVGGAAGLLLAGGFADVLESRLFGVEPLDAGTFVVGALVLLASAAIASVPPALRAVRIDPMEALRSE